MSKKNYEAKSVKKEDHFAEHSLSWDQKYIIPNILNYSIGNLEKSLKIPTHPLNPCTDHPIPPHPGPIYTSSRFEHLNKHRSMKMESSVVKLGAENAVVIFSKSRCCMCHAMKRLFYEQGVSPMVYEVDEQLQGKEMEAALTKLGCTPSVPAVFVGGKLIGSPRNVFTLHLDGSLNKMLKEAGALWL